jgi:hypothetical protein
MAALVCQPRGQHARCRHALRYTQYTMRLTTSSNSELESGAALCQLVAPHGWGNAAGCVGKCLPALYSP